MIARPADARVPDAQLTQATVKVRVLSTHDDHDDCDHNVVMSVNLPARRLMQPAKGLKPFTNPSILASPIFLPFTQTKQSRRTILNIFRKSKVVPTDPLTAEYLTRKPAADNTSPTRGDLAPSSIFESDDAAGPKPTRSSTQTPTTTTTRARDPANMAAALDPDPDSRKRWQRKMVIRDIRGRYRLSKTEKIMRAERQSLSKSHMLKTSVKKLGPLARQIAGKPIEAAIVQMRFSKKLAAREVKKHLVHARNEAIVRRGMGLGEAEGKKGEGKVHIELKNGKKKIVHDRTGIYVDQAWVGRGTYGREPDHRARGQINIMQNPYTSELLPPPPPPPPPPLPPPPLSTIITNKVPET
ncbi:MAG: 54S ribosomal protein L22, mitochondrial [Pleopsidium flavum]|nr:MAG: 54S ribosomal protein L22, mitochondrial [Pleopsidium flavum]